MLRAIHIIILESDSSCRGVIISIFCLKRYHLFSIPFIFYEYYN